ncbi:MAG: hypothetical protein K0R57_3563 [Paenibacillaceae bacterium]|jgi:putative tricarboxylic transport membrane protein|nr:hypothetical protein [Paenibacillaceae bacterium]
MRDGRALPKLRVDRVTGLAVFLAGLLSLREAFRLYQYRSGLLGGDHVFPGIIGLGLLGAGLLLAVFPEKEEHGKAADSVQVDSGQEEFEKLDSEELDSAEEKFEKLDYEKIDPEEPGSGDAAFSGAIHRMRTDGVRGIRSRLPHLPREAVIPVVLLGYTLLLPLAGYLPSTFLACMLLFRFLGAYAWHRCLLGAVLATAGLNFIFIEWLHTPLPAGRLLQQIRG